MITDLVIMLAFIFGMSLILFLRIGVYGYYFYKASKESKKENNQLKDL